VIGVDTNVLLRFVLDDDRIQSARAHQFFEERTPSDPAYVSIVTLVETVWTLRRGEKRTDAEVAGMVRALLGSRTVVVQSAELIIRAARDADEAGADLADALVAHLSLQAGAEYTLTFDAKASRLPAMLAL
jgi:predicted nucleic-acid-binding protein